MHVTFPRSAAENDDDDDLRLLNDVLDQARSWSRAMSAWREGKAPRPRHNDQFQALEPVLDGQVPVFLHTQGERDMQAALDWAAERGFEDLVLIGGPDLQHLADRLAGDGISAILNSVHTMPARGWEPYDEAYVAASRLAEAGVRFAITDGGSAFNAGNARHITFQAGMAAAFGLEPEAALKAVTLWPAEIIGLGDELGSLETGKRATFFAATGDALEVTTRIERAWIDGEEYDFSRDRQRQLYERYRERPRR
jgi:imidazolonepropionase-like amidohydrolase